jgi:DNA-binding Lrp family transcriptional regulator
MNLGSTSDFSIKTYPDINGLDINFSKNSIKLTSQTEALIFGSVSLDENYALEQSTINIYLIDKSSGLKTDLGTLNINKGIAEYNINTKEQDKNIDLIIQNTGNVDGFLKINTEDSEFVAYIPAVTTKTYNLPKQNIKISEDNKVIKSFGVNVSENNLDATKTNIAGFFTLSSNSTANIVFIILIIALILYIFYKILGKMGLFHNSVSAKKLGIKDN